MPPPPEQSEHAEQPQREMQTAYERGIEFGQLVQRVMTIERWQAAFEARMIEQARAYDAKLDAQTRTITQEMERRLAPVAAFVKHQEEDEESRRAAAAQRDRQMQALAERQARMNAWLFPILSTMLVALVGLLASRLVADVPHAISYPLLAGGAVLLLLILLIAARRARGKGTP